MALLVSHRRGAEGSYRTVELHPRVLDECDLIPASLHPHYPLQGKHDREAAAQLGVFQSTA